MPNTTDATTYAEDYGSQTAAENGNGTASENSSGMLTNVKTTSTFSCSSTIATDLNTACENSSGGGTGTTYNAITVKQTASTSTVIGPLFGVPAFNLQATSEAAMRGGEYIPYNVAVIIDTTQSMTGADDGQNDTSNCSTQIQCALLGFQTLLEDLFPCQSSGNCTSTTKSVDNVALYVFPEVTTATVADDDTCTSSGTYPVTEPYTFTSNTAPWAPGGSSSYPSSWSAQSLLPSTNTYQVVGFENGYKLSDANNGVSSLVTTDPLVIASGVGGTNCGIAKIKTTTQGKTTTSSVYLTAGQGTYYAQVIYAAQAALYNESSGTNGNGYQNAMIILSDGNATASASSNQMVSDSGTLNGTGTKTSNASGYESYAYPSALGECGQAVVAAHAVSAAGTIVYTIGYGSETSGGCTTDATYSNSVSNTTYGANSWAPGDQPCAALGAMSTSNQGTDFYSDDASGKDEGCKANDPNNSGITTLTGIFGKIVNNFSTARLVPNGT